MLPASELRVLVGVDGIPEANRQLLKFDAGLKALASSDPTVTLHAQIDDEGFSDFALLKRVAEEPATTTLRAEGDGSGFEDGALKKAIFEDPATTQLCADVEDLGFEDGALKKALFEDPVTTELHAEASGFATAIAQLEAVRAMADTPIVQEVKLELDKSSLAALGVEREVAGAGNGNGNGNGNGGGFLGGLIGGHNGNGHGFLPTILWGNHKSGGGGFMPWWMRLAMGGGALAGAGSIGAFAGFGAEHFLFTGLGLAGSAGSAALGGGLIAAGALGQMAVGGGSDMAVMKSTITDTAELAKKYDALQQAVALYGAHSKQAAMASAQLHLAEQEMGNGPGVKAELGLAKEATALNKFWDKETQEARVQATHVLSQVVQLGHDYVPLVAHAADQNLAIVSKGLKPLFAWLEGPEGTGVFEHLEDQFKHNLPSAMDAFDHGAEFVLKTISVAANYTGGFTEKIDAFFKKWDEPQNFARWEGTMGHLVDDFHLWGMFVKELGRDIVDLFSQDAHTGNAIIETLTGMLHQLGEWERSISGKEELHNLFEVHREEIIALIHVIPPFIGAISPIYMTVAPALTGAMTEILGVFADFLKALDETGPVTRWALGLTLIAGKLLGFKALFAPLGKWMWAPFESLLARAPIIGGFFEKEVSETEALTGATEGLTTAVEELTAAYGGLGVAAEGAAGGETAAAGVGAAAPAIGAGISAQTEAALGIGEGATGAGVAAGSLGSSFAAAGAVAGGYFLTEFGAKIAAPGALEGQNLEESIFHGFNTKGVAQTEARALANVFLREVQTALAHGGNPNALEGASHNRVRTITHDQTQAMRSEASVLRALQSDVVTRMADIRHLAADGALSAATAFGKYSPQWHRASADNMLAAVEAIKAGEKAGLISTELGQREIAHYMREYHLFSGNDPLHIASAFTQSWREAGGVTESGIDDALAEMRKMPPLFEAVALKAMEVQVRQFEHGGQLVKGTFSRLRSAIVTELQSTREHGGAQVEHFVAEFGGAFGGLSLHVMEALQNIGGNVSGVLSKLGVHNIPHFELKALRSTLPEFKSEGNVSPSDLSGLGYQRGGVIDIGAPSGDSVPAMLERGEYVLNRHAVDAMGVHNLNAVNFGSAPRFQTGGHIGPEPHLVGPSGALESLGQAAIHAVYEGAESYLSSHQPHGAGGIGYIPGGSGPVIAQMAHVLFADGFNKIGASGPIGNAWRESRWDPAAIGTGGGGLFGFTSGEISLAALQAAAKRAGVPWTDAGFQVAFMLRHGGAALRPKLNLAHSPEEAARIFMEDWERPGIPALAEREAAARKAFGMGYAEGGLVGREEGLFGVPNSKAASKATPTAAVQWEMAHLGQSQPWDSENPGEWCGDFQAAAMRAIGLTPPSGYSSAAAWANYGAELGKSNMQGGAIIDYDGQHVAMALNSGKMISGNWGGIVATSPIEPSVKGVPITAVRWPPYGHGPGAGSEVKEHLAAHAPYGFHGGSTSAGGTYAPGSGKVATAKLSFGALPTKLSACRKELELRRTQLAQYRAAAAQARGPAEHHALEANIGLLVNRIQALIHQQGTLIAKEHREHVVKAIASRGTFPGVEENVAAHELAYNVANELAEQIVALEPPENATSYIEGAERPAYEAVLREEAAWRNSILGGEQVVSARIGSLREQIKNIEALKAKHPEAYEKQKYRIPALKKAISAAEGVWSPETGSGSLEESLHNIQGYFGGHEVVSALPGAPSAGSYGGLIFQTQMNIHELGLKVAGGGGAASAASTEREHLLEELLLQSHEREALGEIERETLSGTHVLPYAGAYESGGVVAALVGEKGPEIAAFPTGTRIHSAGESSSMLSPKVIINGDIVQEPGDTRDPVELVLGDERFAPAVEQVNNGSSRRSARAARRGYARAGM